MSASAPAGKVSRKKGNDAAVESNESSNGDGVRAFMIQVGAKAWAETKQPETTLVNQNPRKTGFLSAIHIDLVLIDYVAQRPAARFAQSEASYPKGGNPVQQNSPFVSIDLLSAINIDAVCLEVLDVCCPMHYARCRKYNL